MVSIHPGDPLFPDRPEIELPPTSNPDTPSPGWSPERQRPSSEPSIPTPARTGNPEFPRYSAPREQAYLFRDMNF